MARGSIAIQEVGSDLVLADVVFTAVVAADDAVITGVTENTIILVKNTSGAAAESVTIASVNDVYGRSGDITQSIADTKIAAFGKFLPLNWYVSGTTTINIDTADSNLSVAAVNFGYRS